MMVFEELLDRKAADCRSDTVSYVFDDLCFVII